MGVAGIKSVSTQTEIDIELQPASLDIWDKKYRLKDMLANPVDHSIEDTYQRVAEALAEVEEPGKREYWLSSSSGLWSRAPFRPAVLFPMPVPAITNRPPRRSTARYPARCRIRWTASCRWRTRQA